MNEPRIEAVKLNTGGKGETIQRQLPDGKTEKVCLCWYNADFSRGCIGQVFGPLLWEVFLNNGVYAPGNFERYKREGLVNGRCGYCYAQRKNGGGIFPRVVNEDTIADFKRVKPEVVRLGRQTETGHPYYWQTLSDFLDLCSRFGTKVLFPTKMLPFGIEGARETISSSKGIDSVVRIAEARGMPSGKELAKHLIRAGVSLSYSIGYDELEAGPVSQGFTNEWRIRQAVNYHGQGVNVSMAVVCDVTQSIDENVARGSAIELALEARKKYGVNLRILPLRVTSELVAQTACGRNFKSLYQEGVARTPGIFGSEDESCELGRPYAIGVGANNKALPTYAHPEIQWLIDWGAGVCGAIGDREYCDKCNVPGYSGVVFPKCELAEIVFVRRAKKPHPDVRARNKTTPRLF